MLKPQCNPSSITGSDVKVQWGLLTRANTPSLANTVPEKSYLIYAQCQSHFLICLHSKCHQKYVTLLDGLEGPYKLARKSQYKEINVWSPVCLFEKQK